MAKLPFAGAYFFEFFSYDSSDYVATRFRDDKGNIHEIKIDCTDGSFLSIDSNSVWACGADSFQEFINSRLALAESVSCDSFYDAEGKVYADETAYTS